MGGRLGAGQGCRGRAIADGGGEPGRLVGTVEVGEEVAGEGGIARADGYEIRAAAAAADKALFTTMAVLGAAVSALPVLREGFAVRSLQEYARDRSDALAAAEQRAAV